jgi:hypothetical protein
VDIGASFSIHPYSSKAAPMRPTLFGPAGKLISCWGENPFSFSSTTRFLPGLSSWLLCHFLLLEWFLKTF